MTWLLVQPQLDARPARGAGSLAAWSPQDEDSSPMKLNLLHQYDVLSLSKTSSTPGTVSL